jgi:hypothetical protein
MLLAAALALILACAEARAAAYEVGPGRQYQSLQEVTRLLRPGDVVTVDGGATYGGGVSLDANGAPGAGVIIIIGKRANGKRPILSGGLVVLRVRGSHYIISGFDLTAGNDPVTTRCFYNVGDDVTLRDSVVHDCHFNGITGSDASGSLSLDGVEVYGCGQGLYAHQIYVGSNLAKYPRALFRMRHCYVHDGTGGNNVKSRATRNEIEYNWIEGAAFHELDLDGPDPKAQKMPPGAHCDADIAGNVFIKRPTSQGTVARFGSDSTASSQGRYRFVNNTVIVQAKLAAGFGLFWIKGQVDSVALWNNVFWTEAGPIKLVREEGVPPPAFSGDGNWVPTGTTNLPAGVKFIAGADPGFANTTQDDYRPIAGSPLTGTGSAGLAGIKPHSIPPVPNAPPTAESIRPSSRQKDIGAFPFTPL